MIPPAPRGAVHSAQCASRYPTKPLSAPRMCGSGYAGGHHEENTAVHVLPLPLRLLQLAGRHRTPDLQTQPCNVAGAAGIARTGKAAAAEPAPVAWYSVGRQPPSVACVKGGGG
ncbi:hypothetical protein Vafri_3571 [Volvox africanus]|uniref:Uncharacterized protein n=1 Tax=Volvox africanus TaxID=51714 RepID=A0A8J4EUW7_9CHLO|nr:hypothetical protein Vafri_3571 [Volvox africanus]